MLLPGHSTPCWKSFLTIPQFQDLIPLFFFIQNYGAWLPSFQTFLQLPIVSPLPKSFRSITTGELHWPHFLFSWFLWSHNCDASQWCQLCKFISLAVSVYKLSCPATLPATQAFVTKESKSLTWSGTSDAELATLYGMRAFVVKECKSQLSFQLAWNTGWETLTKSHLPHM